MAKELVILGAGGAGKELLFSLSLESDEAKKWDVKGFIDDNPQLQEKAINGLLVLGGINFLKDKRLSVAVCTVANPSTKRKVVSQLKSFGTVDFPIIISSKSIVSPLVEWGEGCIVSMPYNFISVNVQVGDFVFINCSTRIGHDVTIGEYTTIYSDVDVSGGVRIGSDCIIGSGTTINPGVSIGDGCIIGAGAVVTKSVPAGETWGGAPAKSLRKSG